MKQLMSNYGWAVVISIVVAVIIALATPFGMFIANSTINIARMAGTISERSTGNGYDEMVETYENMMGETVTYIESGLYESGSNFKKISINWENLTKKGSDKTSGNAILTIKKDESDDIVKLYSQYNNGNNPSYNELNGDLAIHRNITVIAPYGFAKCQYLTSVRLRNVALIENNAFEDCSNLETIYIDSTALKIVEESVFDGCQKLKTIYFNGTFKEFQQISIKEQNINNTIDVVCKDKTMKIKFN